ncbi:WXG100 family type VII secretion target [Williamsia deligens]|uniref:WXG100 family type VII secretion target n=1 Tax=Williamsia deligens TaxID=321325 RepID=A0ABW3G7M2_9NOCA|nr:hypothetical protein [Williamsia deligens]MCP2192966.1 WXG100 family type VII secretion target [Williamsia deligens]
MSADGLIVYNTGQLTHLLGEIHSKMGQFNQLNEEMQQIRTKIEQSWDPQSEAAASFRAVHQKWTSDVTEIQGVLAQIIRAASDGQGNMSDTERAVARTFNA